MLATQASTAFLLLESVKDRIIYEVVNMSSVVFSPGWQIEMPENKE